MQKWDYKLLQLNWDEETTTFTWTDTKENAENRRISVRLAELGQDGWELLNVQSINYDGTTKFINYFLKRPVE